MDYPGRSVVKNPPAKWETELQSLGQEDTLGKEMATHYSILAWEIPWTEKPVGYCPWGCEGVGQDLVTKQQQHYF